MTEAFIFDALRTPRGKGKKDGALYSVKPVDLVAGLLRALQARNNLDTSQVDDIVLGCVTPVGDQGADIAKTAAMVADWDVSVSGVQLNRFCASGLEAVNMGAMKVRSGFEDLVVVGGVESMSRVPMGSDDSMLDGLNMKLRQRVTMVPQGISADLIATLEGFTRDDVDAFARVSQARAARAMDEERFSRSLFAVVDDEGKVVLDRDEHPRPDTTVEGLAGLSPAFARMGAMAVGPGGETLDELALKVYPRAGAIAHVHTGGNSSGIVDGAAVVLLGSEDWGKAAGMTPRARIRAMATAGAEPVIMLTAPTPASQKALKKAGMAVSDIDLWEINEAFAVVPLHTMRNLGIDHDKVNVNGGAIALGHPLGATGAMLLGTALDELERSGKSTALITLCIGGGMGIATIIERV
jgi:acetyl-CoA C-acetyltransferase